MEKWLRTYLLTNLQKKSPNLPFRCLDVISSVISKLRLFLDIWVMDQQKSRSWLLRTNFSLSSSPPRSTSPCQFRRSHKITRQEKRNHKKNNKSQKKTINQKESQKSQGITKNLEKSRSWLLRTNFSLSSSPPRSTSQFRPSHKITRNNKKSQEITKTHKESQKIIRIYKKSWGITNKLLRTNFSLSSSPTRTTSQFRQSHKITRNNKKSQGITKNHEESPKGHKESQKYYEESQKYYEESHKNYKKSKKIKRLWKAQNI